MLEPDPIPDLKICFQDSSVSAARSALKETDLSSVFSQTCPLCAFSYGCNQQKQARISLSSLSHASPCTSLGWSTVSGNQIILLWYLLILGKKTACVWLITFSLILQSQVVMTALSFVPCIFWKGGWVWALLLLPLSHVPSFLQSPCYSDSCAHISLPFPSLLFSFFTLPLPFSPITAGNWQNVSRVNSVPSLSSQSSACTNTSEHQQ